MLRIRQVHMHTMTRKRRGRPGVGDFPTIAVVAVVAGSRCCRNSIGGVLCFDPQNEQGVQRVVKT